VVLNNMGEVFRKQGKYRGAEALLQRALAIREKAAGPDSLAAAPIIENLARLYHLDGRITESEKQWRRALRIYEREYGPDPATAREARAGLAAAMQADRRPSRRPQPSNSYRPIP
jgi:tetratricopeptide (TPR) repeat protein